MTRTIHLGFAKWTKNVSLPSKSSPSYRMAAAESAKGASRYDVRIGGGHGKADVVREVA